MPRAAETILGSMKLRESFGAVGGNNLGCEEIEAGEHSFARIQPHFD
jgi:hypothetical protein